MVNQDIIRKQKLLSVRIPQQSRASEFYFPDQPDLRGAKLTALWAVPISVVPKTYENNFPVSAAIFAQSYITLYDMTGFAFVDKIPLYNFQKMIGADTANVWGTIFNGQMVNWTKSFIHLADIALISIVQDEYYQVVVNYEKDFKPK
jgi:hypothetical protein